MSAQRNNSASPTKKRTPANRSGTDAAGSRARVPARKAAPAPEPAPRSPILDARLRNELIGVVIAVVSIALFIAVVAPGNAILARAISSVLRLSIGVGAWVLPFLLLLWAASFFTRRDFTNSIVRLGFGILLIFVGALSIAAATTAGAGQTPALLFDADALMAHGGYVGAGLAWCLIKLVGTVIAIVLFVGMILTGAVLIGFSITGLIERVRRLFVRAPGTDETPVNQSAYVLDGPGAGQPGAAGAGGALGALIAPTVQLAKRRNETAGAAVDFSEGDQARMHLDKAGLGATRRALAGGALIDEDPAEGALDAHLDDTVLFDDGPGADADADADADAGIGGAFGPAAQGAQAAQGSGGAQDAQGAQAAQGSGGTRAARAKSARAAATATTTTPSTTASAAVAAAIARAVEDRPFKLPEMKMLRASKSKSATRAGVAELRQTAQELQGTLDEFGVDGRVMDWVAGPTVTLFKVALGEGVRLSKVTNLADDIALALAAPAVRIFAPIPGTTLVGIEVPNVRRSMVLLGDVLPDASEGPLQMAVGKDVEGDSVVADLEKMPHLLIGGTTGSGKSVAINAMIMSILMRARPDEVRMILIDPKMVELSLYNEIPQLYVPVVTDAQKAAAALAWGVIEMERRLKTFKEAGVKNLAQYNDWVRAERERVFGELESEAARADAKAARADAEAARASLESEAAKGPSDSEAARASFEFDALDGSFDGEHEHPDKGDVSSDSDAATSAAPTAATAPAPSPAPTAATAPTTNPAPTTPPNPAADILAATERALDDLPEHLPLIVIVIDELADLMMIAGKEVETSISRIAQLARAAGLHLIIATQRPSTNVITGLIKANIVNRIAFNVASGIDSRVILDTPGAEDLIGLGDLLFSRPEYGKPQRIQGCYVSEPEIAAVVDFLRSQGAPEYHEDIFATAVGGISTIQMGNGTGGSDDPMTWEAAEIVVSSQFGSTSALQRRLSVGYARAGRIMDILEQKGIVGPANGSKPREVLVADVLELESLKAIEGADGDDSW